MKKRGYYSPEVRERAVRLGCSRRRLHTRLSGRYGLQTINGEPLPSRFLDSEIVAADIQLNDDGTCLITSTERNESGVLTTGSDEGCTWTSEGTAITVTDSNGPLTGSVDDDRLTLNVQGAVFVLARR